MARKSGAIIKSRNKKVVREEVIVCPYCGDKYNDETENDYYEYLNTKINYCRACGAEFINGITRDVVFKEAWERRKKRNK